MCVLFGKCWKFHVDHVLETTPEENLRMIRESCRFLRDRGKTVIFDGEHFFDGYKDDRDFALAALQAAAEGGAHQLCLCDTNGGAFPQEVGPVVEEVIGRFGLPVGVHFHNDCGMAVANSVMGVMAGAAQVQGDAFGLWGALRQRQPGGGDPRPAAEAGHPPASPRSGCSCCLTAPGRWPPSPTWTCPTPCPTWGTTPSPTRPACTPTGC